jgi:hypothetical protein
MKRVVRVRPGADQRMGATKSTRGTHSQSGSGYVWDLTKPGAAPTGRYYAVVKPTATCEGDRSGTTQLAGF